MNILFEINDFKDKITDESIKKILIGMNLYFDRKIIKNCVIYWKYEFNFKINGIVYNASEINDCIIIKKIDNGKK
jgi:hypothetical protein